MMGAVPSGDDAALWLLACVPALALAIDRVLGEPAARWHPVVWMGRYLAWAGARVAPAAGAPRVRSDTRTPVRSDTDTDTRTPVRSDERIFWSAALAWCGAASAVFALAWWLQAWVLQQPVWLAALALGLLLKPLLAWAPLISS